jgi:hypothetical protein
MWMRSYPRHAILYWQFIQKINFGYTYLLDLSFFQNLLFVKIYCPDTAFLGPCSCHLRVRYLCLNQLQKAQLGFERPKRLNASVCWKLR